MASTDAIVPAGGWKKPKEIFFNIVHERNINLVRKLLEVSLPVQYPQEWYNDLIKTPHDFTKMAYYNDIFAGMTACKVETLEDGSKAIYIMAIAVLAAYRGYGIGTALLQELLHNVSKHPEIKQVYLHVWTANEDAIRFYTKHGFEKGEKLEGYYKMNRGVEPPDAWRLNLAVNASATGAAASKQ